MIKRAKEAITRLIFLTFKYDLSQQHELEPGKMRKQTDWRAFLFYSGWLHSHSVSHRQLHRTLPYLTAKATYTKIQNKPLLKHMRVGCHLKRTYSQLVPPWRSHWCPKKPCLSEMIHRLTLHASLTLPTPTLDRDKRKGPSTHLLPTPATLSTRMKQSGDILPSSGAVDLEMVSDGVTCPPVCMRANMRIEEGAVCVGDMYSCNSCGWIWECVSLHALIKDGQASVIMPLAVPALWMPNTTEHAQSSQAWRLQRPHRTHLKVLTCVCVSFPYFFLCPFCSSLIKRSVLELFILNSFYQNFIISSDMHLRAPFQMFSTVL